MPCSRVLVCLWLSAFFCCTTNPLGATNFDPGADPPYAAAILIEAESGTSLFEYNAHVPRSPASTQKLLLKLVVMDLVAAGKFALDESVQVSAWASSMGGSQVYLKQGEVFSLEELMEAIAIHSANDACVAVAEYISGSVEGFVDLMNARARALELLHTRCVNVHGLDDTPSNNGNLTTAHELAQIARPLLLYPQVLEWSSIRRKPFRQGKFILNGTNKLVGRFKGLDGLKTGYTRRAGFCLVATAKRQNMRLISVVMGAPFEKVRDRETTRLLNWGFNTFAKVPLVQAGESMGKVQLDWGLEPEVQVQARDTVIAVLSPLQEKQLKREFQLPAEHPAPVEAGQELGLLKVSMGDSLLAQVELVAMKSVGRMGLWEMLLSYF